MIEQDIFSLEMIPLLEMDLALQGVNDSSVLHSTTAHHQVIQAMISALSYEIKRLRLGVIQQHGEILLVD